MKHLILVFLALIPCLALAQRGGGGRTRGPGEGGGGKGVLCDGTLRSLDLWEAENIHSLHLPRPFGDYDPAIKYYYPKLLQYGNSLTDLAMITHVDNSKTPSWWQLERLVTKLFVDVNEDLPETQDATLPTLPQGCRFVQILVQYGPGEKDSGYNGWDGPPLSIHRDMRYWKMLSGEDQAALILHEFLYTLRGLRYQPSSDDIRRAIGLVFSDQNLTPFNYAVRKAYRTTNAFSCQTYDAFRIEVVPETRNGVDGLGIYFVQLNGVYQVLETSAFAPGIDLKTANTTRQLTLKLVANTPFMSRKHNVEIQFGNFQIRAWKKGAPIPELIKGDCNNLPWK